MPGSSDAVTIASGYVQTAGTLNFGLNSIADYGRLQVNANAQLGGTLSATPSQIAVVVPNDLPAGKAMVTVTAKGASSPPVNFLVTSPVGAVLSVATTNGAAVVSWTAASAGAQLESALSLSPPTIWTPVTNAPAVINGRIQVTLAPDEAERFFRLRNAAVPGDLQSGGASTGHSLVSASAGGSVVTDDQSATLLTPPGALAQDTDIQITSIHAPGAGDSSAGGDVLLSPEGLTFSTPVTLRMQLPGNPPDGYEIGVELLSGENGPVDVGGEISYFQSVTNYVFDPATAQLEAPLTHFSGVSWFFAKKLYAVLKMDPPRGHGAG